MMNSIPIAALDHKRLNAFNALEAGILLWVVKKITLNLLLASIGVGADWFWEHVSEFRVPPGLI